MRLHGPIGRLAAPDARLLALLLLASALAACVGRLAPTTADRPSPTPRSPAARQAAAEAAVAGVQVRPVVTERSLLATDAIADFGVGREVRLVLVRILDELGLDLELSAATPIVLARPPRVCLVGPDAAPDDAGLSDRCWGEPDLESLVARALSTDPDGRSLLDPARPVRLTASLRRGDVRCDFPPGTWLLEVTLQPLIDGQPVEPIELAPIPLDVPSSGAEPLRLQRQDTRYCGLATRVYLEQGEPPVLESPEGAPPTP